MNIILVSSRLAKARSITLGKSHLLLIMLLLCALVLAGTTVLQYVLVRYAPAVLGSDARALLISEQKEEQQKQQSYMHNSLDAMAVKLGQMQAQLQRLDALGGRLAKLTGMKPQEFMFDQPPAQGGPLVTSSVQQMTTIDLEQELQRLTQIISDRSDKLTALETMLMQNQLSSKLLPSVAPIKEGWYSSNFGWRIDPFTGQRAMHEGVDYMVPGGTPIYASAGGVVAYADNHPQYGNMVEIDHGNGIITRYAHASRLLVKVAQVVQRGEKIAEVGDTGRATGSHLHFEVRYKGIAQNPVRFLQNATARR